MKLYEVSNGFVGFGPVIMLCIAPDEDRCRELSSAALREKEEARARKDATRAGSKPNPRYWDPENLEVDVLRDDLSQEWASRPSDEGGYV